LAGEVIDMIEAHDASHGGQFEDTLPAIATALVVVLLDDNDDERGFLQEALKMHNYIVFAARTGREALAALDRMPPPSVVLLPLMMPIMSGLHVIQAMRTDPQLGATPVILMTTSTCPTPCAGVHVLQSPFDVDRLLALIGEVALPRGGIQARPLRARAEISPSA